MLASGAVQNSPFYPPVPVDQVAIEERVHALAKRSIKKQAKVQGLKLAIAMMDLTTLEGKDTAGKVTALCAKALRPLDSDGSVGPWLSYQSVLVLEEGRPDRAAWHGPAAGLQFHTKLLEPITAGAWPIRRGVTPLGYSSFTVAYVHLFRRGDAGGSPGMLATFEHTLPEL